MTFPPAEMNRRILVVDDNRSIHGDFRKILACDRNTDTAGALETALFGDTGDTRNAIRFEIDSAYQGRDGLEMVKLAMAEGRPYAMAFMDVRMPPGWDGFEAAARIREVDPEMHIVICTAYSGHSWEQVRRELGHSDKLAILQKPFDNIEALQLATALTEKWNLARHAKPQFDSLETPIAERTRE